VVTLLLFDVCLGWMWWGGNRTMLDMLIILLPVGGFQAFAVLTMHYSLTSEAARAELGEVNAELLATRRLLEESARSAERLKLSRELHDVTGHKLTALKLNLAQLVRDPTLAAREEVRLSAELADELLSDIRAVVGELRVHDGIDLGEALQALVQSIPGTRFTIELDPLARVDQIATAETLLRCAQEGITNALRHGRAKSIELRCHRIGERLELCVTDNGAERPTLRFGNGLTGMRERLEAQGGSLDVGPAQGRGVRLVATLPVSA
jgi:signal transduction histidine kinase